MWKHLNLEYKAALNRFTLSGTHSSNFFDFCTGCHEICYMQKHLDSKPDWVATVVADLPDKVFMESSDKPSSTISSSTKHKHEKECDIADAICELWTSHLEVELSKQKMDLMQHQEECWAAEHFLGNRSK